MSEMLTAEEREATVLVLLDAGFRYDTAFYSLIASDAAREKRIAVLEALVERLTAAAITESYCRLCRKVLLTGNFYEGHAAGCAMILTPEQALAEKEKP